MARTSHLVEAHLGVSAGSYDAAIRRFVPFYDEMLEAAVESVAATLPPPADSGGAGPLIVELGVGTGALCDALAARLPAAHFRALDCDARMLATARQRLARWGERVNFVEGSFDAGLPAGDASCVAVVASLALHHVRDLEAKTALYRMIFSALAPGGVFVNADAFLAASGAPRTRALETWITHQIACEIPEPEARQNLENWQRDEDRYFSLEQELGALAQAGFPVADVLWRRGPMAVLLATRER